MRNRGQKQVANLIDEALRKAVANHQAGDLGGAARAYRAILRRAPNHPDALHLLGLTAHQSGDHSRAIRHMERAIAIRPEDTLYIGNLGLAQHAAGQLAAAEVSFRRILGINPADEMARMHLGTALALQGEDAAALEQFQTLIDGGAPVPIWHAKAGQACRNLGRFEESESYFRRAVALAPDDMELLASLASLLQIRGRNEQAIKLYHQVLVQLPNYAEVHLNLGNCLINQGSLNKAVAAFEAALDLAPGLEGVIAGLVSVHERQGNFDYAWRCLEPAMGKSSGAPLSPVIATAFAILAPRLGKEEEALKYGEESLTNEEQRKKVGNPSEIIGVGASEMNLRFALGGLYERKSAFDPAIGQFQAANAMSRQIFDVTDFEAYIQSMESSFPEKKPDIVADNEDLTPVFIVGMPRSGTTLVEQILSCHPQIHGAGELPYLSESLNSMQIDNPFNVSYPRSLTLAKKSDLNDSAGQYLRRLRNLAPRADRIIDKMPLNFLHLGMIVRLFPQARIIHIRRDPLDTCLSCFTQNFGERLPFTTDFGHLAVYYSGYDRISRHWDRTIDKSRMTELIYEELVADPEGESRRLLAFLGLPWDSGVLNFHESDRIVSTASYNQVRQPLYRGSICRWHRFKKHLGPLIEGLQAGNVALDL